MKRCHGGLLALAALLAAAPAVAEPAAGPSATTCQSSGTDRGVVLGRLRLMEGLGPAAFILTIPAGICLTGSAEADALGRATTVQLYSDTADGMERLYSLVGKRVMARGRLSAGSTYQQKAPILMNVLEIAEY